MDVDQSRKLVLISRDPRSYRGSTTREPGEADPNGATNIAGVYVVDARNPADLKLLAFQQLPTGHTTTCINDCQWLWTGGPASTTTQQKAPLNWAGGRPIIVTDLRDPAHPVAHPMEPIDLFRQDGVTAYSHDVQVDDLGIAWVSGPGRHARLLDRRDASRPAHRAQAARRRRWSRSRTRAAGSPRARPTTTRAASSTTRSGRSAATRRAAYRNGEYLLRPRRTSPTAKLGCSKQGHFNIATLKGSYNGEAWRSTPKHKFRLKASGRGRRTSRRAHARWAGPTRRAPSSARRTTSTCAGAPSRYAWYGEGTRFLDISEPAAPEADRLLAA